MFGTKEIVVEAVSFFAREAEYLLGTGRKVIAKILSERLRAPSTAGSGPPKICRRVGGVSAAGAVNFFQNDLNQFMAK